MALYRAWHDYAAIDPPCPLLLKLLPGELRVPGDFPAVEDALQIHQKKGIQAEEKGTSTSMSIIDGLLEAAAKKYVGLEE